MGHQVVRFLLVGGVSYVVDLGALLALPHPLGLSLPTATTGAYLVAFVFTFTLNRLWVFGAGEQPVGGQMVRYLVLVGVNYLLTLVLVLGLVRLGVPVAVAKTVSVGLIAVLNFVAYRRFVFRD